MIASTSAGDLSTGSTRRFLERGGDGNNAAAAEGSIDSQTTPAVAGPLVHILPMLQRTLSTARFPLFLIGLFLFTSKLMPIWLLIIFGFFACQSLVKYLPASVLERFLQTSLGRFRQSTACREITEGLGYLKPILYAVVLLAAPPIAVLSMFVHWFRRTFCKPIEITVDGSPEDKLKLHQNVQSRDRPKEDNFYQSAAFPITIFCVFALGVPVLIALGLYHQLGIDALLNAQQAALLLPDTFSPRPLSRLPITATPLSTIGHFFAYMYLFSLGWCISLLFFRAYFTFPYNFVSTEYDIEIDAEGIRKHKIKGFIAELYLYCWPQTTPTFVSWNDVTKASYWSGGIGRLKPLPESLFSRHSQIYKFLNLIAGFTDSFIDKLGRTEYLSFSSREQCGLFSGIKINLWELNNREKARLFYAIRKWAPSIYLDSRVQEKLIGSSVMKEPRYTQIWFDVLMSNPGVKRTGALTQGVKLCGQKYEIVDALANGGQANVFLARTAENSAVVLKEFVLSPGEAFGAVIESASDFENESSVLSRLSHPSIIRMLDIFAEDQRAYVVLEYADGLSLREHVRKHGPFSEREVIDLAGRMSDVLRYLHEQEPPVVHRDFTPENIILQKDGSIKVIDFSVASKTGPHESGDCVGKHAYTPPEQFRSEASPQSDIYALGATMYYLLTGCDPRPISKSNPNKHAARFLKKPKHVFGTESLPLVAGESNAVSEPAGAMLFVAGESNAVSEPAGAMLFVAGESNAVSEPAGAMLFVAGESNAVSEPVGAMPCIALDSNEFRMADEMQMTCRSERLAAIIEKATELELDKRYESIEWMQLDLQSLHQRNCDCFLCASSIKIPLPAISKTVVEDMDFLHGGMITIIPDSTMATERLHAIPVRRMASKEDETG